MPIKLGQPLAWTTADADELQMLYDLQGNILKSHGRAFTYNLFLRFDADGETSRAAARAFVHQIAATLPSAYQQLQANGAYKKSGTDGGLFTAFFLTARGYGALGRADLKPTVNAQPFEDGMIQRSPALNDPVVETWNETFRGDLAEPPIHAMLMIADANEAVRDAQRAAVVSMIAATNGAVTLLGTEEGRALQNADGHGIEHFGYVDGRSQPLMLVEDWNEENAKGGVDQWDPKIPLGQVLVPCPGGESANSHGSYFVFRKLEQNVRGFKKDEKQLADFLKLKANGEDEELAGAMVVGRFENGTPVLQSRIDVSQSGKDVPNNFNYLGDPNGLKCPFTGHIRKANPRGETEVKFGVPAGTEIEHLMARRGIPYGRRTKHPNDEDASFEDLPAGDVGLLFMAYQSNLETQFEFTQQTWVNNPGFVGPNTGIDPIIGQTPGANAQRWPERWGGPLAAQPYDFSDWVTLQGGEYFFAPAISMLKTM